MPVSAREIVERVAREHDTTVKDIFSQSKFKEHVRARWAAVKQIHEEHPTWSMVRIGRFMGRDHTSILHVFRKHGIRSRVQVHKRPWSDEEDAYLIAEWPKGTRYDLLAGTLRRSYCTIKHRAEELGMSPRPQGRRITLTPDDVREIRASSKSSAVLAQRYGVTEGHVRKVQRRQRRREVL